MVCGLSLAISNSSSPKYKELSAATPNSLPVLDLSKAQIPLDLQLSQVKDKERDTVYVTKTDTIVQVTKVKRGKASAPKPIIKRDTIYYIATQMVNKEDTTCRYYKLHQADKHEIVNSSEDHK